MHRRAQNVFTTVFSCFCIFQGGYIKHEKTGLCLDMDVEGPIMKNCDSSVVTQLWQFNTYVEDKSASLIKAR